MYLCMKDFAGSRNTYYSLAREKLRGKHPRVFNILLVLVLISMTGLAAFLLSDIISFGSNSDHKSFLVGFEHQEPIKSIMSIINWNEKNIEPAVLDNPVVQKGGLIGLSVANSSPKINDMSRMGVNISGEKNSSLLQMDGSNQKAKERNPSNSSPTPNSFSSKRVSSDSAVRNTASGSSSNKLVKENGTTASIKTHQGSSRETPVSQSLKQKDIQQDLDYANNTKVNSTQVNSTKANNTQLRNIQAENTSIDQLQTKETSTIESTIDETSISQPQTNPSPPKSSQIILSQINAAEADSLQPNPSSNKPQSSETRTIGNKKTSGGNSPANPVAAPATEAQNTAEKTALIKSAADIRADSADDLAKDVSAKNTLKIEFKTDSTISPESENSPGGGHTGSGAVSGANAPSSPIISESSPEQYTKNDARNSGDSTSISNSLAIRKGSESAQKPRPAVTSKTQKAQEIRYQKIANKNRLAENAKKKAALARERAR